jgi:hypothetical protein
VLPGRTDKLSAKRIECCPSYFSQNFLNRLMALQRTEIF